MMDSTDLMFYAVSNLNAQLSDRRTTGYRTVVSFFSLNLSEETSGRVEILEAIEAKVNKHTRKWLGVPPGLSDVALYCRKAKLKLPMKSTLEEYKCGKARLLTMLEESDDPVVSTVQPSLKIGRK
ncbi:polyprotein [Plakobranchus ocellatus]|uniref:Polyprotein n=1 Tax=Plakobranchus ocellatus TaxID=259542 RepID=A0AAV4CB25_9GAST|nr:polyprotein [Plakobranchus ocellatus]